MKSKLTAALLALLMLISFMSCSENNGGDEDTSAAVTDGGTTKDTKDVGPGLEAVDFGGADFVVLNLAMVSSNYPYKEIDAEASDPSVINDAVYRRNDILNAKYNISIKSFMAGDRDAVSKALEVDVKAGDSSYDLVMQTPSHSVNLAATGLIYDYSEIPHVNLDAEWWFTDTVSQLSISNIVYYAPCYANICFLSSTGIVYFSKDMVKDYELDIPYTIVESGEWTLEEFIRLSRQVTSVNNKSPEDTVGFRMHPGSWGFLFTGCSGMMIRKNSDDLPVLDIGERALTLLQSVIDLSINPGIGFYVEYAEVKEAFVNGRSLFMVQPAYDLEYYRQMADFGIVPLPKYDINQEDYISTIHQDWGSLMSVEITQDDLDMIGRILEDMAYESYKIIKPTYYDKMLQGQYAKDMESAKMLDIIYRSVTIDLSLFFKKYGINYDSIVRSAIKSGSSSIASKVQAQKRLTERMIESIIEDFERQ